MYYEDLFLPIDKFFDFLLFLFPGHLHNEPSSADQWCLGAGKVNNP